MVFWNFRFHSNRSISGMNTSLLADLFATFCHKQIEKKDTHETVDTRRTSH